MPTSTIISDNGVLSGTTGLKTAGGDDGTLLLQTTTAGGTATTAVTINTTQVVTLTNALPVGSGGTGVTSAGTTGNVLTSNGTAWVSQAISAGGDYIMQAYLSPATWTKPASIKAVKVTVIGAGGNGGAAFSNTANGGSASGGGGAGGTAIEYLDAPAIPGPVSVTAGPGTNSFGAFCSATAGSNGSASPPLGNNSGNSGGAGGAGSGGTFNMNGGGGGAGYTEPSGNTLASGVGGSSSLGGGGAAVYQTISNPATGGAGSVGGGGAGSVRGQNVPSGSTAGGAGGAGIVIVEEFY